MPSPSRVLHLAGSGFRALAGGDPALRRRVADPLRARVAPTPVAGLDPLLAGYVRGGERAGVDATVATALRTRSDLLRRAAGELASRTGAPTWRGGYGELLVTAGDPDEVRAGMAVLRELVETGHAAALTPRQSLLYAHGLLIHPAESGEGAAVLRRHLPRLTRLTRDQVADLATDLAHPDLTSDEETWWRHLTGRWREGGALVPRLLADVELEATLDGATDFPGGAPLLDRVAPDPEELAALRSGVAARASAAVGGTRTEDDLPLVSVVVTAYRPGPWLATAIRSLRDQTWPNLEVIVVDDASGADHAESIARMSALHPSARVVTRRRNGGAYRARNRGIAEAKGDYLAFLDADDWNHPERIERQVLPLLTDPDLPATGCRAIRAHEDLRLAWPGYPAVRTNASGIVLSAATAGRVGTFDDVRKSADSEYEDRVRAVTGRAPRIVAPPMQLTRLRGGSLSRSDFGVGWGSGPRTGYRSAYRAWHDHLADLRAKREIPGQPETAVEYPAGPPPDRALDWATGDGEPALTRLRPRPFAAPHSWLSRRAHAPFDVLVVDDAADPDPPHDLGDALERLLDLDLRIGLLHREDQSVLRRHPRPLLPPVRALLDARHDVVQVHPEEAVEAAVVWVRRPEVLSAGRPAASVTAPAVVVTEPTTFRSHRVPHGWDVDAVTAELQRWGAPTTGTAQWLPNACAEARVHHLATSDPEAP